MVEIGRNIVGFRCFLNKGMNKWNIVEEELLSFSGIRIVYIDVCKNIVKY